MRLKNKEYPCPSLKQRFWFKWSKVEHRRCIFKTSSWTSNAVQSGGLNNGSQRYRVLIPETCRCYFAWQKRILQLWLRFLRWGEYLALCGWVLNTVTIVLIQERQREIWHTQRKRWHEGGEERDLKIWSDVAISQGIPAATKSWNSKEWILSWSLWKEHCQQLDFSPVILFCTSVLQIYEKISSVVLGPNFVVISYGSHRKLIWPGLAISALVSLTTIKIIKKAKLRATSEPFHLFSSHRGELFPIASLGWLQEAFPDLWPKPN